MINPTLYIHRMLIPREVGKGDSKAYRDSMFYFCNSPVNLDLYQNQKLIFEIRTAFEFSCLVNLSLWHLLKHFTSQSWKQSLSYSHTNADQALLREKQTIPSLSKHFPRAHHILAPICGICCWISGARFLQARLGNVHQRGHSFDLRHDSDLKQR